MGPVSSGSSRGAWTACYTEVLFSQMGSGVTVSRPWTTRLTGGFGRLYRGREGQWSWVTHRFTGVAVILFLFVHVVDTALVGWGPNAYNRVVRVYHNPGIRFLELVLVAAVIYHALNGVRIMLIDFWPRLALWNRQLIYGTWTVFVVGMIPIAYLIGRPIVEAIF
jgi:succinate dehydrogenase / fumarate reductase cytochrome b subunit